MGDRQLPDFGSNRCQNFRNLLAFPADSNQCAWGTNGNLPALNNWFQARREQVRPITLPAGAVLCGVEFTAASKYFLYDDSMYLLFNDVIVAGSHNVMPFVQDGTIYRWDWARLRGQRHDRYGKKPKYCIPGALCTIPASERVGSLAIQVSPDLAYFLSGQAIAQGRLEITTVVTGDREFTDCKHNGLNINAVVRWKQY